MGVMKKRIWSIALAAVLLLTSSGIGSVVNAEEGAVSGTEVQVSADTNEEEMQQSVSAGAEIQETTEDNNIEETATEPAADSEGEAAAGMSGEMMSSIQTYASGIVVYYAVPEDWLTGEYTICANGCESKTENIWTKEDMTEIGAVTSDGKKIYKAEMPKTKYNGYDQFQFLAWKGDKAEKYVTAVSSWTLETSINSKLWDGTSWVDYTELDLNDHTSFAGEQMVFLDNTNTLRNVVARFFEPDGNGNKQLVKEIVMDGDGTDHRYYVTIPNQACSYVQFVGGRDYNTPLGDAFSNFYEGDPDCTENFVYNKSTQYCYTYNGDEGNSTWGVLSGAITVYYDATLSKLSYANSSTKVKGIPYPDTEDVWCYVTGDSKTPMTIQMQKELNADVYKAVIPDGYTSIRFAGYEVKDTIVSQNGDATDMVDIPMGYREPCFYGDTSDDVLYVIGSKNRGGYWGEKSSVRNAEAGKNSTVVDVPTGTLTRDADKLYVNTTLYDYYTDYELNGNNRDNYDESAPKNSHRIYQPFRQFNMALSDEYNKMSAASPIYWGNFQNYSGKDSHHFDEIADTMKLFGYDYDKKAKFFYENNSMWGINGSDSVVLSDGENAVQGLAADELLNDSLALKDANERPIAAPFFDENFLSGSNSKNAVLGKVYKDVTFPFAKESRPVNGSATVDYWYFDSASTIATNKNLKLRYNDSDGYFLQSTDDAVNGVTAEGSTSAGNYFPFNESAQSANAAQLNYGFGQRFDLKFRLPKDGQILDSEGNPVNVEFNFSGDDDVWVFIDGHLVLDVGGAHGVVTGTIDFAQKKATVSSVKPVSGTGCLKGVVSDFSGITDITGGTDDSAYYTKEHTLTMFYMERGLWESNMKLSFNFAMENKLTVEKEVDTSAANPIFAEAMKNMKAFEFDIQNLATSGPEKVVGAPEIPAEEAVFNDYTVTGCVMPPKMNGSYATQDQQNQKFTWYCPGEKKATDPQSTTDQRIATIPYKDKGNLGKTTLDLTDNNKKLKYEYLQFEVLNTDISLDGTSPFVALVDEDGTRIGEWGSRLDYNNGSNNIGKGEKKTIRIDLEKIQNFVIDTGSTAGFDFTKVKEIQFAYWNDVVIEVGPMVFKKPAQGASTGFTKKQEDIPDYGSIKDNTLKPVNGSWYMKSDGKTYIVEDGTIHLGDKESAVFSDQFRRGSYVYVAEKNVNPKVFDTTWSLYENGQLVSDEYLTQDYLNNNSYTSVTGSGGSVQNQSGTVVDDGRTEAKTNAGVTAPNQALVFRSYAFPDNAATIIDLKAKFTNTLKTGKLTLKKELSIGETETVAGRKYKFVIEYRNIAGMSLESTLQDGSDGYKDSIVQEIELAVGESITIDGIPAGTDYTIHEVIEEGQGYHLANIEVTDVGNDSSIKIENNTVTGIVVADDAVTDATGTAFTFVNTITPTIEIRGKKTWEGDISEIPNDKSIVVQLQQKEKGKPDEAFTQATDRDGNLVPSQVVNVNTNWEYFFSNLLKYVDYTANPKVEYEYRVVELGEMIDAKDFGGLVIPDPDNSQHRKPIEGYYPEYSTDTNGNLNILNKKTGSLTIKKEDADGKVLKGAGFTLYEEDGTTIAKDINNKELTGETDVNGILKFENIKAGTVDKPITYYLKETKTVNGYVLLKDPIKVVLPYSYNKGDIVNGKPVDTAGVTWHITYTIVNDKAFDLPASGRKGIIPFLVVGVAVAITAGSVLGMRTVPNRRRRRRHRRHSR